MFVLPVVPFVTDALLVFAAVTISSCEPSVLSTEAPTDWAIRGAEVGAGMLALRLTFLLTTWALPPGAGDPPLLFAVVVLPPPFELLFIWGKLSRNVLKVFLVSSFMILDISLFRRCLSALKGDILFLWPVFCYSEPKPDASVVFDLELIFCMVSAGFIVGMVLITHK